MCGIVGYIGDLQAKSIVLKGLKQLEYRGYDSAGIALMQEDTLQHTIFKDIGRVSHLASLVDSVSDARLGIGHTRWATHGPVTQANAHPHQSRNGRFLVVHNGVIENYKQLIKDYLNDEVLKSQTDSEVIVNLIALFAKTNPVPIAILKTLNLLEGSYALLILDQDNPTVLYGAKHKSPLLLGKCPKGHILASDMLAMCEEATHFYAIPDQTLLTLSEQHVDLSNLEGESLTLTYEHLEMDALQCDLGNHPHYMLKEIYEQPTVIRRIVEKYYEESLLSDEFIQKIKAAERLYILAAGTSLNAGYIGKVLIERLANIPVEVHIASEFAYHPPLLVKKPVFIMISQSGETADLRACLINIKKLGFPIFTITNVKTSTLAREADDFLEIFAGPEIAVASTKAYTAQIAVLAILSEALGHHYDMRSKLAQVAQSMDYFLSQASHVQNLVKMLLTKRNAFYIGRGLDYFVCLEAALKLKEISYIQTEGFAAGELKHGTIALIEKDTPVIAIISSLSIAANTESNLQEVKARGAKALVIATDDLNLSDVDIVLNHVDALLTPMVTVLPAQMIAYYAAHMLGYDIDKPRNLAKSVTVE